MSLTADELTHFHKWYHDADTDQNGLLSVLELALALKEMTGNEVPTPLLEAFISTLDKNGDSMIDWLEFRKAMTEIKTGVRTGPIAERIKPKMGW
ncbi:hypothetical protein Pelo_1149 [Pelomyxa schiedti]|nr:hypothetical protein Pelo_1149 [Pelomyxa schiedti]